MLRLFNTLGRKFGDFRPEDEKVVSIFTCGPSVYQRSHIGNFRTFLFEDVLVRYLEYSGRTVQRGMNFTDIEDKALAEAEKVGTGISELAGRHIREFMKEMKLLKMKTPDFLPRASGSVDEAVALILRLLELGVAYRYRSNIYFDPLKAPRFGELFGLDMSKWPKKKVRFHKDTYPGMRWNLGDFILWHGCREEDPVCWNTEVGRGWPSWNIQDPAMITKYFHETLSIYCGGIDNLYRHHDYTKAILESVRPWPMAKFWLHCHHLYVNGHKMSKSKGNILYTDTLVKKGYTASEMRFFLIYGHYRTKLDYSDAVMRSTAGRLKALRDMVGKIRRKAGRTADRRGQVLNLDISQKTTKPEITESGANVKIQDLTPLNLKKAFSARMDDDLDVKGAFDDVFGILAKVDPDGLTQGEAAEIISGVEDIDEVFRVIAQ